MGSIKQLQCCSVDACSPLPPCTLVSPGLLHRRCRSHVHAAADASIPVHINNICERNYVSIQGGRRVVPTELGITLVRGYQLIDPELCQPQVGWRHQSCVLPLRIHHVSLRMVWTIFLGWAQSSFDS